MPMNLGPKLIPRTALKQTLTPGLVQMVNILAMNKLELQEAINQELLENPMLEEAQEEPTTVEELLEAEEELRRDAPADAEVLAAAGTGEEGSADQPDPMVAVAGVEGIAESASEAAVAIEAASAAVDAAGDPASPGDWEAAPEAPAAPEKVDPFEEIDFGSFFDDYLDPGYRSTETEEIERPSFENFISAPTTLTDHLRWQLGSSAVGPEVREAAEAVIGNLDEDGYLTSEDNTGRRPMDLRELADSEQLPLEATQRGLELVQSFDPPGVAARDLRECLLLQLKHLNPTDALAVRLVSDHLTTLQKRDHKELLRHLNISLEELEQALGIIRRLDPYPGRQYNKTTARLIEPEVYFVKGRAAPCPVCGHDDCENRYRIQTNEDGLPQLSLNRQFRSMRLDKSQRDVARYIRDRYASAIQFLKNVEQRRQTILRVCHSIVARQGDFLDFGIDHLRPMMIKDVAEEIGVHPSTVSRAVANKYAHTPQGVFELRYFFSEAVQGARGAETSLIMLKRRVKKLIEDEDPRHPLTDDQITRCLREEGIEVTRRTVAKYREDLNIPSTHRRRRKE
jgi:RNA polymerase sigma-54 factor